MDKKLSRRSFLKAAALGTVGLGFMGLGTGMTKAKAEEAGAKYNAGTYTSTQSTGFATVDVTATFSENAIEDISYEVTETSASDFFPVNEDALKAMLENIKSAQSVEVDGVTGATLCSSALKSGVSDCINQASVNAVAAEGGEGGGAGGPGGMGGSSLDVEAAKAAAKADGRVWGYAGPGDWLGEAPVITAFTKEMDCDVLVIGCGHAGVQAAYAAAEEGAKVICVDKQANLTWYGEDFGAWNSSMAIAQGFGPYNLGEVIDEFVTRGGGRSNQEIVRQYVANSGECMDNMLKVAEEMGVDSRAWTYDNTPDGWLIIQSNVDYDKYMETGDMYASLQKNYPLKPGTRTWAASHQFMGVYNDEPIQGVAANSVLPLINSALIAKAERDFGAEYYMGVAGIKLIQNENGDVIGAYVQDTATGEYWKVNTAKGVVVCGGDYAGNADMCWATLNEKMEKAERAGLQKADFWSFMGGRDGSAIKMCCWAGGFIETAPRGDMSLGGGPSGPWGCNAMLWLNVEGKRFCNEGNITAAQAASYRCKSGTGCLVTDQKWLKSVCNSGIEHGGPNAGRPQYYIDMVEGMNAIEPGTFGQVKNCTIAERGYSSVACANTLDELFDLLGVYPDEASRAAAKASIEHYNEMCEAGADTDYGKAASVMIPVNEGPYYGMTASFGPGSTTPSMVTMSGMLTDDNLQVLNADNEPIKGLFVAGNCLGGRYGTGYSTPCAGNSIGFAGTHGRVAGKNAAKA